MMKFKTLTTFLLSTGAWEAQAHAGLHTGGFLQNMVHFLTEPDHLAIVAAASFGGYLLYRRVRRNS